MSRPTVHKKKVEAAYDDSSQMYDEAVGRGMMRSTVTLLRDAVIAENPAALDVGCGTGISTFELLKRCQGKGRFYGIDISREMIEKAQQSASKLGYSNVEFSKGDAEKLSFPSNSFDLVISNQAFHWVPNKLKALREMHRVLKPKGHLALHFSGKNNNGEMLDIGLKITQNERKSLSGAAEAAKSLRYAKALHINLERTHELFDEAGFRDPRIFAVHQIAYIDPSVLVTARDATAAFWQIGLPSDVLEEIKRECINEAKKRSTSRGFKNTSYAITAYATKTQ